MGYYKCTCCSCDVAVINCNTQYPRDELCDWCVSREYWAQRAEIAALKDEVERLKDAEISLEADVEHLWDSRNDGWNRARAWKRCAKRYFMHPYFIQKRSAEMFYRRWLKKTK